MDDDRLIEGAPDTWVSITASARFRDHLEAAVEATGGAVGRTEERRGRTRYERLHARRGDSHAFFDLEPKGGPHPDFDFVLAGGEAELAVDVVVALAVRLGKKVTLTDVWGYEDPVGITAKQAPRVRPEALRLFRQR